MPKRTKIPISVEYIGLEGPEPLVQVFKCPYCSSTAGTHTREKTSGAGWVVAVLMLIICFPLFFLGLGINESSTYCRNCGTKIA